jgi:hypothetical protein
MYYLMTFTAKNLSSLIGLCFLGCVVGGLAWELLERILANVGVRLTLSVGPIGFDIHVLSLYFLVNPGTFLGLFGGALLFRLL